MRSMMALVQRTIVAAAMLAALLAGCSAAQLGDTLPNSMGGLPENAPARPNVNNRQSPAVYNMPAPRSPQPLNEEDQVKLEKDLQGLRDRQNAAAKDAPPAPAAAPPPPAKKQAGAKAAGTKAADGKTSGTKPNP